MEIEYDVVKLWHGKTKCTKKLISFEQYKKRKTKRKEKKIVIGETKTKVKNDPLISSFLQIKYGSIQFLKINSEIRSFQNIVGFLLEEFLILKTKQTKWFHCHDTISGCDFIHPKYEPIQIKNKSNDENSSSSKIRKNRPIQIWFRLNAYTGKTNWLKLNLLFHKKIFIDEESTEKQFQTFVMKKIQSK